MEGCSGEPGVRGPEAGVPEDEASAAMLVGASTTEDVATEDVATEDVATEAGQAFSMRKFVAMPR